MPLINVNGLAAHQISASHPPGEIAPTFTVTIFPDGGTEQAVSTHLTYFPPDKVTFTIGNVSWACVLKDSPRRITGNTVGYTCRYEPIVLRTLRLGSYKKNVSWVSCPEWEFEQYQKSLDEEEWEIYFKRSDPYPSNGFSVNQIFEDVGKLIGQPITAKFPELPVTEKSVILQKEQKFLDFLRSLLPSGFVYVWDWQFGQLTVALAEPSTSGLTVPPGAYDIEYDVPEVVPYNAVTITGGRYKINYGISLRMSDSLGSLSSQTRGNQVISEELPPETRQVNGHTQTTQATRTLQTDPDGNSFAVLTETEEISGPIFNAKGQFAREGVLQRRTTTHHYENADASIYQEPRLIKSTTTTSGYVTAISSQKELSSDGTLWYLTEDLSVINRADYLNIPFADRPSVLGSARVVWRESYEQTSETKSYIQGTQVTLDWPEGYETNDDQAVTRHTFKIKGNIYECTESGQTILQQVASSLQNEEEPSIGSIAAMSRVVESRQRKNKLQAPSCYAFEETVGGLDRTTGGLTPNTQCVRINSTPPSAPTKYRTKPLELTLCDEGATVLYAFHGQIPTCNPQAFQIWGSKLFRDQTQPPRTMGVTVPNYVVPQGYRLGGGTVIGWEATQDGGRSQARMTII